MNLPKQIISLNGVYDFGGSLYRSEITKTKFDFYASQYHISGSSVCKIVSYPTKPFIFSRTTGFYTKTLA